MTEMFFIKTFILFYLEKANMNSQGKVSNLSFQFYIPS